MSILIGQVKRKSQHNEVTGVIWYYPSKFLSLTLIAPDNSSSNAF